MTTKSLGVISVSVICVVALVGVMLMSALRTPIERVPFKSGPANGPGVVRVSIVEGSAVVQRGNSRVQTSAVPNAPMLPGDYISTGKTSRAELQFDGYTALRLGGSAQARIVSNDPNDRKVQLAGGTIEIGMVHDAQPLQIDTPSVSVRAHQAGDVRITIAADGSSWVTVRSGGADVVTSQRNYTLGTGTTLIARGAASDPSIAYGPQVAVDSFDDFNQARDNTMIAALNASPNLNPSLAGFADLGAYGQWQAVAGHGESWVPNEPAGWAPYRNGSWSWEGGYGWTWIGDEPWGWTPYHYGNWFYCDCGASGWAWLPPAHAATPSWSPALVGFFEFNTGQIAYNNNCYGNYGYAPGSAVAPAAAAPSNSVAQTPYGAPAPTPAPYGVGGPSPGYGPPGYGPPGPGYAAPYGGGAYPYIGWVPIAPGEPYYPWYPGWAWLGFGWGFPFVGGFGGFGTRFVSVTNITNITNIYRNFRHGGATGTTFRNFRHGTLTGHTLAVRPRDIGRARTIHGALPVTPTRNNLGFSHGTLHAPATISKAFNTPRFASDRALAARTTFAQQQKTVTSAIHGGLTGRATAHASTTAATAHTNAAVAHANAPVTHASNFGTRGYSPVTHANAPVARENAPVAREHAAPVTRENAASAMRTNSAPLTRENAAPAMRANAAPFTRENAAPMTHENAAPAMRENNPLTPETGEMHGGSAEPTTSWARFDEARGEARADFSGRSEGASSSMDARGAQAPGGSGRGEQGPSDSWGRFSNSRGDSAGSMRNPYDDRGSYPSDSRGSYGNSRNPYDERGSYPSYSRGSYPSYSRGSYPSYSRGSYPSYARGSYPSYPRGSSGSGGSYSRGYSSPPHSSGGGGGGGGGRPGGGRPPQ